MVMPATSSISTAVMDRFLDHCHRRRYPAKSLIIYAGDVPDVLYYILSGSVTVLIEDAAVATKPGQGRLLAAAPQPAMPAPPAVVPVLAVTTGDALRAGAGEVGLPTERLRSLLADSSGQIASGERGTDGDGARDKTCENGVCCLHGGTPNRMALGAL